MARQSEDINQNLKLLTQQLKKQNSPAYTLFLAVLTGVGTAIGATVVASIVLFILTSLVTSVEDVPLLNNLIQSVQQVEQKVDPTS